MNVLMSYNTICDALNYFQCHLLKNKKRMKFNKITLFDPKKMLDNSITWINMLVQLLVSYLSVV